MRALVAVIVCCLAGGARAEPRVIVVETRDAPVLPTLVPQVEVHASGRATVGAVVEREADPLTFAERATAMVAAGEAAIVVWLARVDGGYLVFAAGRWPGRALLELVRVDEALGASEIERTIALKVAGLLDVLLAAPSAPAGEARAALGGVRHGAANVGARWRIEVSGQLAREPHERGADPRTVVGIGRAWRRGGWTLAPSVAGYWQPSGAIDGATGRATVTEVGAAIAVEAARGPVFARPRVVLGALRAEGESGDGRAGRATLFAPYAGLEVGVRREISEAAALGVVAGGEVAWRHHELAVDDRVVVDVGRARLHVGVMLTVGL
ncbi:MAG: hypothetical protein KF773_22160 [Deltaproteobacteria bacterium]|nr:hypothetical protein [Deltaproteobacteria bacterium]